jgi:class 3 adenylate cyclase
MYRESDYQDFDTLAAVPYAFDMMTRRRRIFKVETIGDWYVAVADSIVISKFAADTLNVTHKVTRKLEFPLGPESGDLALRIAMRSCPVAGGVVCGERARFQLFGDTSTIAACMEQARMKDKIQIS